MTLNPAMGNYLDIDRQHQARRTRTTRREILQLFSIGTFRLNPDGTQQLDLHGQPIPTYDPGRPSTTSRACSPAGVGPPRRRTGVPNYIDPMVANQSQHDIGAKTLLNGAVLPANQATREGPRTTRSTTSSTIRTSARSSRSS